MENLYKGLFIVGSGILLLIGMLALEKALRKENRARLYLVVFMVMAALYYASYGVYFIAPIAHSPLLYSSILSFSPGYGDGDYAKIQICSQASYITGTLFRIHSFSADILSRS
jgi:hypothetical protein